jgi:hypothetical protein
MHSAADNVKVAFASLLGVAAPGANLFLDDAEPVLKFFLLLGQIAVAAVTAIYIYAKWRNLKGDKGDKGDKGSRGAKGEKGDTGGDNDE